MSRGPGVVERTIYAAFRDNPDSSYTTDELVMLAFPNDSRSLKARRVSVLRAAHKIAEQVNWDTMRIERHGRFGRDAQGIWRYSQDNVGLLFYNKVNLKSYTRARQRVGSSVTGHWRGKIQGFVPTDTDVDMYPMDGLDELIKPNTGRWWQIVEKCKYEVSGKAMPAKLQKAIDKIDTEIASGFWRESLEDYRKREAEWEAEREAKAEARREANRQRIARMAQKKSALMQARKNGRSESV
jgi:hypothetical protein